MFRTLRTRLLLMYVLVAVTLVLIVACAITAFALSRFALGTNETVAEVARGASDLARNGFYRKGTLEKTAPEIARRLERSGVRIVVMQSRNGALVPLAFSNAGGERHFERPQFPLRLNILLRMHPKRVEIPGGEIVIFPDPHPLEQAMSGFWIAMIPLGVLVGCIAFFFGRYITDQALRPLVETTESLRRFASGDFTPRPIQTVEYVGHDEIGELVSAYNGAAAQVASALEERTKAELEMRQFIADASHELRTPLTVIMGFLDVLRRRSCDDPAKTARIYDTMQIESRRMKALVEKLILLARLENPQERSCEEVDLGKLVGRVASVLGALQASGRVRMFADPDILTYGNENELHDAVANLVENALKYAPQSSVDVRVYAQGERAVVEVTDRGPGLSEEEQAHVFDRFYRGNNRGQTPGFGLGLAIAKRAVERAGGEITLVSAPGEGCCFTIWLARAPEEKKAPVLGV